MPNKSFLAELLMLGEHYISGIKTMHGFEDLPIGLDPRRLLTLKLPSISVRGAGDVIGTREFYLCYHHANQRR